MNRERTKTDYACRIVRVMDYMHDNLDGDLSADTLAEIANFSTFHWHRIFHAMTGSTVAETVRRLRLHRAASDLLHPNRSIRKAAERAGYTSVEAFSRAFRNAYGQPPSAFRQKRLLDVPVEVFVDMEGMEMRDVAIKRIDQINLCTLPHRGDYNGIGRTFEKLSVLAGPAGLMGPATKLVGIYFDDPTEVPVEKLRSAAGLTVGDAEIPDGNGFEPFTLDSGKHAILRHVGPYSDLAGSYQWLYGAWLPQSGEEAADRPCFEIYRNDPANTAPAELLTDIHMPLQ